MDALPEGSKNLYFTGISDKFFIYFKVSIYAAIVLVSPYLLYEVWRFISPGLHRHEKRFVVPFLFLGSFFFALGIVFCYTLVIPYGYKFLLNFGSPDEKAMITLTEYFKITTQLLLGMGLVFQLPVILMLLAKFGIVQTSLLTKFRGQSYVGLSVLAAFITPTPDAFTMVLVIIPLFLLYECSVILVRWVSKPKTEESR
jgi:sec-independent protein translocase protein TatC